MVSFYGQTSDISLESSRLYKQKLATYSHQLYPTNTSYYVNSELRAREFAKIRRASTDYPRETKREISYAECV